LKRATVTITKMQGAKLRGEPQPNH